MSTVLQQLQKARAESRWATITYDINGDGSKLNEHRCRVSHAYMATNGSGAQVVVARNGRHKMTLTVSKIVNVELSEPVAISVPEGYITVFPDDWSAIGGMAQNVPTSSLPKYDGWTADRNGLPVIMKPSATMEEIPF